MASDVNVVWHFAIPIYTKQVENFTAEKQALIDFIQKLRQEDPDGMNRSNQQGWHSTSKMHDLEGQSTQWLIEEIGSFSRDCMEEFHGSLDGLQIQLVSSWANINGEGAWNSPHNHMPAHWSGVFYVTVRDPNIPEGELVDTGKIDFLNPLPFGKNYGRSSRVSYSPKDGLFVLFPSHLEHMVQPNRTQHERISIAFNFNVKGATTIKL